MNAPCETASLILLPFDLVCGSSSGEGVLPMAADALEWGGLGRCLSFSSVTRARYIEDQRSSFGRPWLRSDGERRRMLDPLSRSRRTHHGLDPRTRTTDAEGRSQDRLYARVHAATPRWAGDGEAEAAVAATAADDCADPPLGCDSELADAAACACDH